MKFAGFTLWVSLLRLMYVRMALTKTLHREWAGLEANTVVERHVLCKTGNSCAGMEQNEEQKHVFVVPEKKQPASLSLWKLEEERPLLPSCSSNEEKSHDTATLFIVPFILHGLDLIWNGTHGDETLEYKTGDRFGKKRHKRGTLGWTPPPWADPSQCGPRTSWLTPPNRADTPQGWPPRSCTPDSRRERLILSKLSHSHCVSIPSKWHQCNDFRQSVSSSVRALGSQAWWVYSNIL